MDVVIILAVLIVGLVVAVWLINRRLKGLTQKEDQASFLMLHQSIQGMQQRMDETNKTLQEKLDRHSQTVTQSVHAQLGESAKIVRDVTEKLTKLDETNRQVINYSEQLRKLQDILQNPKRRGVLGEYYLDALLKNILPPGQYAMQVDLGIDDSTGQKLIADAVVFVQDKLVPIDAKFTLENYNRMAEAVDESERVKFEKAFVTDLKSRIQETAKYVRPDRGTLDFAFMFIPHEAIYYDLLTNKVGGVEDGQNLLQRAGSKYRVIIVSPTSFLAYLQTVLQGLRALQLQESTKDIMRRVEDLRRHMTNVDTNMEKLGRHINNASSAYQSTANELDKAGKDVSKIVELESKVEPMQLEKPNEH
ncbi:MAG: DNA recombination protein RmuC [Candidatus Kerfeldbacteria bacterium]|nr:DNA recombination protein RmuC [Candidatus Kerfeldbacteria bacterium]